MPEPMLLKHLNSEQVKNKPLIPNKRKKSSQTKQKEQESIDEILTNYDRIKLELRVLQADKAESISQRDTKIEELEMKLEESYELRQSVDTRELENLRFKLDQSMADNQ